MMEVFDIAARISVIDGASKVIGALMASVPQLGKHFEDLEKKAHGASARIKIALAGIGTAMVGVGAFEGLDKLEQAGEDLVHVKTLFQAALPAAERVAGMAKITAAAFKESADNVRSTLVGNVAAMHDLFVVTQSVDHAIQLLPAYNRLANTFASVKDQEHLGAAASSGNIASAIRAFELTGRNTADKLEKASDGFVRATIALGEKAISGSQLMTQISNAGDSRYGWSDDFLTKVLPAMIATGLQNRTGSALNAGSNNLYGGVASSQFQGTFQEKWGLHRKADELLDSQGKFKGFKVGSMWEADQYRANPLAWANDFRKMLHDQRGVNVDDAKTMQDIIGEIGRGNKLLKAELDELLLPQTNAQLNKEVGNVGKVGADALNVINEKDPKAAREALAKKWKDATDALGEQLVQPLIDNVIKPLTGVLKDVTKFAGEHPAQIKEIGVALLKLSAGLTAIGTALAAAALIAALSPVGWLIVGIGALGTAAAMFAPDAFDNVINGIRKLYNFVMDPFGLGDGSTMKHAPQTPYVPGGSGLGFGLRHKTSFTEDGGGAAGTLNVQTGILNIVDFGSLGSGGGTGSGGGLIRASYGGAANDNGGGYVGGGSADGIMNGAGGGGFNTRGVRNLNPGNIGWGKWAAAHGATAGAGADSGHLVAVFPSFESGYAAMGSLALSKYSAGARSIDQLIAGAHGWTPGNHAAAANVARMMGISPYGDAGLNDPSMLAKFKAGLSVQELGPAGARYARDHLHAATRAGGGSRQITIINHNHTHLDSKVIAMSTTRHQAREGMFPTAVGGIDSHGSFASPGTPLIDVA